MMRARAVRSLLVEQVAGIHLPRPDGEEPSPEELDEALGAATRRALMVSALLAVGLVLLVASRPPNEPFFLFVGTDTVFSLAALAVAGYAGLRLCQWRVYRAVARALASLPVEEVE